MNDWPLWLARTPNGNVLHLTERGSSRSLCGRAVDSTSRRWSGTPFGMCRTCVSRAATL